MILILWKTEWELWTINFSLVKFVASSATFSRDTSKAWNSGKFPLLTGKKKHASSIFALLQPRIIHYREPPDETQTLSLSICMGRLMMIFVSEAPSSSSSGNGTDKNALCWFWKWELLLSLFRFGWLVYRGFGGEFSAQIKAPSDMTWNEFAGCLLGSLVLEWGFFCMFAMCEGISVMKMKQRVWGKSFEQTKPGIDWLVLFVLWVSYWYPDFEWNSVKIFSPSKPRMDHICIFLFD